ncbi:xylulokinase [Listeria monocytogenes]|uniref:xylulokinase n=1 Tax=Listeria monocytogenes TaxID=1639 RepID=UPI0011EB2106|nr:xylulokinase [Listeria monocytogenes]TYU82727.1 xylulokinase [Listeria monocytogenes]
MAYVLGLDLGTSALKGLLLNNQGKVIYRASAEYPLIHLQSGYSEQDPVEWTKACEKVFDTLAEQVADFREQLVGISFSGQMHSLVVLDENQNVIRPAILWNDVRTTKQCQRITSDLGKTLIQVTKNKALEGFTLPKILWLQENEPETWQKVRHILLPKDYLGFWLTGTTHMDYSDAAGTLLLDVQKKQWSKMILETFEIPISYLPRLIDSQEQTGKLKPNFIEKYGFEQPVKVFAGGSDNACGALGSGILSTDTGMVSIGTSGVFLSFEDQVLPNYQGELHLFNHSLPNTYYSMGVTLAAGHSLSWFKETFAKNLSYDELLTGIDQIAPGAEGLLFTPYIVGERTPYPDSQIRGSFIGIDTKHTLQHFTKAVLEGITFSLKDSLNLMEEITEKKFKQIVSVGGGAKNQDWLQMQADIFNSEIYCLTVEEGPGLGAAMLAAVGVGWFKDLSICAQTFISYRKAVTPNAENVAKYEDQYALYREVYPATKVICAELQSNN